MFSGITTVLPVYQADPVGLRRAAESVLSQECPVPLELLVIDDGSDLPAASALTGLDVRVVRLPRNRGLVFALNVGLIEARHDLIARIDADDFWRPGKLARQVAEFAADDNLTLCATSMRLVHPGQPELDRDELRGADWPQTLALAERIGCPFPHGSILARREIFEQLGGYPHAALVAHAEDWALWSVWIRFFEVKILPEVLFEYTVHAGQISSRYAREQLWATDHIRSTFPALPEPDFRLDLEAAKARHNAWLFR